MKRMPYVPDNHSKRYKAVVSALEKNALNSVERMQDKRYAWMAFVSFATGFLTGMSSHHWWLVIVDGIIYLLFFLVWRKVYRVLKERADTAS